MATKQAKLKTKNSSSFKENLKTKLTEAELKNYSKDLADKTIQHVQVEANKKSKVKEFTATLDDIVKDINVLSQKVSSLHEFRTVECHWSYNFTTGIKMLVREDTNLTVRTAKITDVDRQNLLAIKPIDKKVDDKRK